MAYSGAGQTYERVVGGALDKVADTFRPVMRAWDAYQRNGEKVLEVMDAVTYPLVVVVMGAGAFLAVVVGIPLLIGIEVAIVVRVAQAVLAVLP